MLKRKRIITYNFIDLFAGAGGLSLGFSQLGFHNLFAIDNNPEACCTYRHNFPTHCLLEQGIDVLSKAQIQKILSGKQVDVVIGGPPCQGFSLAGNPGRTFVDDPRNKLFREFARIVDIVRPKVFVMENVARLFSHNNGQTREEILSVFHKLGYQVQCHVFDVAKFGVPQHRNRIIFIGTIPELSIKFPNPSKNKEVSVKEAIQSLPPLNSGQKSSIPNHEAMHHSAQMLEKMSYVKDGGTREDIPSSLRPTSGDARKYIRYSSKSPSFCITGDMRKIFHYEQNRALTVRELARLQSFPDNFIFLGNSISQQQQVGNAVPPKFAEALAKTVKDILNA
ncbi:DNA cytosine methyltransferase [Candidatus Avelusimicrobium fimicolum]|uniref:DNA cytosine methyltransferase n=1 Tax=Candidatus Avelusimicrobium fimicolum TaxID=3416216 RepID=UPI003D0CB311